MARTRLNACIVRMMPLLRVSAPFVALTMTAAVAAENTFDFDVPAGPLANVLTRIGVDSASTISFSPAAVKGLQSGPVSGRMKARAAVSRAIAGTNLKILIAPGGAITIVGDSEAAPSAAPSDLATDIADIDVFGLSANGSTDPLATEGTHRYAATDANIATKTPLSIQETPQTVSVLTQQQIDDRHITTLDQAVDATPGLTTLTGAAAGGTNLDTVYQSRGFTINSVSIDGGSPLQFGATGTGARGGGAFLSNLRPIQDMSEYDSLEVLRGAGGQYSGVGDPGGTLSLERKRPLDHGFFTVDQTFGSYRDYRTVLDGSTTPLLDGNLKIRGTFVNEGTHYFYDYAKKNVDQVYLNIEFNLTPTTRLNFGGSHNDTRANPWLGGLPAYSNGTLVDVPRSTCLCVPWGRTEIISNEYFLQAEQVLPRDWSFHFNGSVNKQRSWNNLLDVYASNGLNPDTTGLSAGEQVNSLKSDQYGADGYVSGRLNPFGILTELAGGGAYANIQQANLGDPLSFQYPSETLTTIPWNAGQFQPVPISELSESLLTQPAYNQQQLAAYGSARISPFSWAHLLLSERVSDYRQHTISAFAGVADDARFHQVHAPIPNVGVTFDVLQDISIYGSYATNYQTVQALTSPDGPNAPPIQGSTWEAGIKRSFFNDRLHASAAYYTSSETGLPVLNPTYAAYAEQSAYHCCYLVDNSRYVSSGVDLDINGKITETWDIALSYNYNNNESVAGSLSQAQTTALNSQFPKHIVKLFTTVRPRFGGSFLDSYLCKMQIGFGADYKSEQKNFGLALVTDPTTNQKTQEQFFTSQPGYVVFQAMLRYDVTRNASLQLNAYNLLDRKYYQTVDTFTGGNWYGTPRSFSGSLHLTF